ncbi:MAG: DUF1080 domain-containing protein [Dysgonamonadaceae bacterium]|jgi:hypothetical protein|nr:DUF1080 domain-containing protein [Dysgonamonadaceae bacterium]
MRKIYVLLIALVAIVFGACNSSEGRPFQEENITVTENSTVMFGKGNYTDFELNMTVRTIGDATGYIAFHTDKNGKGGYQVSIDNTTVGNPQWWTKTGSLLGVRNLTQSTVETNEWFDMTIRVEGKSIAVSLNDQLVVDYVEPAIPYRTAENARQLLSNGKFAMSNTGGGVIEIKSMNVMPINSEMDIAWQQSIAIDETTDHIIRLHQANFPVIDYHVHLKGMTDNEAAVLSRRYGINYVMAPNCGIGFPITNDEQVIDYVNSMKGKPFLLAMQGEGREWVTTFSKEVREKFDFVFTDALTFTDTKGRRTRLWVPEEVIIDNEQQYMDLIVEKIVEVITNEPIDVYVNPTFLPEVMNNRYDYFWTDARMDKVIAALLESDVALEINEHYRIPNKKFVQKAKDAGLKFTFGTNNMNANFGKLEYCIELKYEVGITVSDMFIPYLNR